MSEPKVNKEELDKFLDSNDVDENAAQDLRGCPAEVQKIVLSRGDLSSARNPSAALIARIRDARTSVFSGHHVPGGDKGTSSIDPKTAADVEEFIKANKIDDSAAASLRGSSADVQKAVLARGELTGARNPSSALLSRIRDAKAAPAGGVVVVPGHGYVMPMGAIPPPPGGYGYGGYPMPPPPPGYPNSYGYGQAAYYGMYGYPYGAYSGMPGYPPTSSSYGDYGAPLGGKNRSQSRNRRRNRSCSGSPANQSSSAGSSSSSRSCSKARRGKKAAKARRRGGRRKKRAKSASVSPSKERTKSPSSSPSPSPSPSPARKSKRKRR